MKNANYEAPHYAVFTSLLSPVTSSFLGPDILLSTLFSNILVCVSHTQMCLHKRTVPAQICQYDKKVNSLRLYFNKSIPYKFNLEFHLWTEERHGKASRSSAADATATLCLSGTWFDYRPGIGYCFVISDTDIMS
jgi:hypothetical protein